MTLGDGAAPDDIATITCRTGRTPARADAAHRGRQRDMHALLPVFCCDASYGKQPSA
ncbi:hypothetical protein GCM10022214_59570 [Actinomadura miaoliensis]|uniref:Uncharacterized protein n=1 Tax=Actinomadura miaoliensis TaxID=430685 RepID=A0ABP7WK72_9ACTN